MNNFFTHWDNKVVICVSNQINKPLSMIYFIISGKNFKIVLISSSKCFFICAVFFYEQFGNTPQTLYTL